MKTKALYVLVSSENDFYLEQAYLSIYSLKLHNPNMCVVVLMDDITSKGLVGKREKFLTVVNEKVVIELDETWKPLKKSRYLKTSARKYIEGDYLFIDTDTIIVSSLEEIDDCKYDLAAVRDNHTTIDKLHGDATMKLLEKYPFSIKNNIHCYNSGVFYVRDCDVSRRFYEQWNKMWLQSEQLGIFQDQPSLNILNNQLDLISELNGTWNCQLLKNGLKFFTNAKIVHYYNTFVRKIGYSYSNPYYFTDKEVFNRIKLSMSIDDDIRIKLLNYTAEFSDLIELVSGDDLELIHSKQYRLLSYLYTLCNPLFNIFEFVLCKLSCMFRKKGLL